MACIAVGGVHASVKVLIQGPILQSATKNCNFQAYVAMKYAEKFDGCWLHRSGDMHLYTSSIHATVPIPLQNQGYNILQISGVLIC